MNWIVGSYHLINIILQTPANIKFSESDAYKFLLTTHRAMAPCDRSFVTQEFSSKDCSLKVRVISEFHCSEVAAFSSPTPMCL